MSFFFRKADDYKEKYSVVLKDLEENWMPRLVFLHSSEQVPLSNEFLISIRQKARYVSNKRLHKHLFRRSLYDVTKFRNVLDELIDSRLCLYKHGSKKQNYVVFITVTPSQKSEISLTDRVYELVDLSAITFGAYVAYNLFVSTFVYIRDF